jgi:hypothetical protein
MSTKATAFIENLITYDYILFGASFGLFLLFIILAIVIRKKVTIAILLVLLGFGIFILGPTLGYIKMHEYLFKNSVSLTSQKKLSFSEAVVVKGTLTNESKFDFKSCKITASAYKVTKNEYKNYINKLKPFKNMSIVEYDIKKGKSIEFKIFIEPFTYSKDYNVSLGADCR